MICGTPGPRFGRLLRGMLGLFTPCCFRTRKPHNSTGLHGDPRPVNVPGTIVCDALTSPLQEPTVNQPNEFFFFPSPIDTSNVDLPGWITLLRDRLAENLHELWSVNKIQAGWSFAQNRDDASKKHPCLTSYEKLTEEEKNYDINLTMETLKALLALGYGICKGSGTLEERTKLMEVPGSYTQSNGYKPTPYDLSFIELGSGIMELVEALAGNMHEIWAANRMKEGWRFGKSEDNGCKRSPNLVPYEMADLAIKKANRDAVMTIIKSLLATGANLHPPDEQLDEMNHIFWVPK